MDQSLKGAVQPRLDPTRDAVEQLGEEFVSRYRRGELPLIEEYAVRFPEHAEEIRELFPTLAAMEGFKERVQRTVAAQLIPQAARLRQLGDFRLLREIGRGGMGVVYEAEQQSLGRRVAVKVLLRALHLDGKQLQRFEREARTAAALHHTNIVPVFGVGHQDDLNYYVMQAIPGVSLDRVLARLVTGAASQQPADMKSAASELLRVTGASAAAPPLTTGGTVLIAAQQAPSKTTGEEPVPRVAPSTPETEDIAPGAVTDPTLVTSGQKQGSIGPGNRIVGRARLDAGHWRDVARLGVQVAEALDYAHAQQVLHRDIKPANLLLEESGTVWIADFGLAKALENDGVSSTGDIVGTLRYMAPEQLSGNTDARSDLYSLGMTLYELATLQRGFEDSNRSRLLQRLLREEPVAPRSIDPRIPRDLETIILKSIAREPARRYQKAAELAEDLRLFLEDRPIRARRASAAEQLWRWCRRNPALAGTSAAALLLLATAALSLSVAYVRTSAALTRESVQREKTNAALDISLEALDEVYQRFVPDRLALSSQLTVTGDDGEEFELAVPPALSQETASVLRDLLPFYDRLAALESDDLRLKIAVARAHRRMGDIYQRLGQTAQAEAGYREAIAAYERLTANALTSAEIAVELARAENELGNIYRQKRELEKASVAFSAARGHLERLATAAAAPPSVLLELARTYYFLGQRPEFAPGGGPPAGPPPGPPRTRRPPRDGFGPPGRPPGRGRHPGFPRLDEEPGPPRAPVPPGQAENLARAVELLQRVDEQGAGGPETRYLLALCYRDQPAEANTGAAKAVAILTELCERHPTIAEYRHALIETAMRTGPRPALFGDENTASAETGLRDLLKQAELLSAQHPQEPRYAASLAHLYHRLGMMLQHGSRHLHGPQRDERLDEAEQHHRNAVRVQQALAARSADAPYWNAWNARLNQALAEVLLELGRLEEARKVLEASLGDLRERAATDETREFGDAIRARSEDLLSEIDERLRDPDSSRRSPPGPPGSGGPPGFGGPPRPSGRRPEGFGPGPPPNGPPGAPPRRGNVSQRD